MKVAGEATCGKFKAHHVKNCPTAHPGRRGKKSQCHESFTLFYVVASEGRRRTETYLLSNKRISPINKDCFGDLSRTMNMKMETGEKTREKKTSTSAP